MWECYTNSIRKSPSRIIFRRLLGGVFYEMNGNFDYAWYGSIALSVFAGLIHLPINEKPIERDKQHKLKLIHI